MSRIIARPPAVWSLSRIVPPVREVVSIDEARIQCRVPDYEDPTDNAVVNGQLVRYITAAREYVEAATGRTFYRTTWRAVVSVTSDYVILPRATPLREVISVRWRSDVGQDWVEVAAGGDYVVDVASECGGIVLRRASGNVEVVYVAGIDESDEVPAIARQAILLVVSHYWENREAETITDRAAVSATMFKHGLDALIQMLRVI